MKKSIYLLIFIFLIGYDMPVTTMSPLIKHAKNITRKKTNIPKKSYNTPWLQRATYRTTSKIKNLQYKTKKKYSKAKMEFQERSQSYLEKFNNLIHGYRFKSDTGILHDAFKGDKVKNIEYLLSKHNSWKIVRIPEIGYLTLIEAAVWTKNFKIADYLLKQERVFLDDRVHYFYPGEEPKKITVNLDIPNVLTRGLIKLREWWFDKKHSGLTFYPNDLECVKYLLDHGVNINQAMKKSGETALMLAARYGEKDLVKFLLENGAKSDKLGNTKINFEDIHNASAEYIAQKAGHPEIAQLITKFRQQKKEELKLAIQSGQKYSVEHLLKNGADINQGFDIKIGEKDVYASPEMIAQRSGHPEIAEWISKYRLEQEAKKQVKEKSPFIQD